MPVNGPTWGGVGHALDAPDLDLVHGQAKRRVPEVHGRLTWPLRAKKHTGVEEPNSLGPERRLRSRFRGGARHIFVNRDTRLVLLILGTGANQHFRIARKVGRLHEGRFVEQDDVRPGAPGLRCSEHHPIHIHVGSGGEVFGHNVGRQVFGVLVAWQDGAAALFSLDPEVFSYLDPSGGESFAAFQSRIRAALQRILRPGEPLPLIVGHGGMIMALSIPPGQPVSNPRKVGNCAFLFIEGASRESSDMWEISSLR